MSIYSGVNFIMKKYCAYRYAHIDAYKKDPASIQKTIFKEIISKAKDTEWGKKYDYASIKSIKDFQARIEPQEYDHIRGYIARMMDGQQNILWPDKIKWYAKSSGTTNDKSKYIPVSDENLKNCHIKGGWDAVTLIYNNLKDAKLFQNKSILLGGALETFPNNPNIIAGDISAIMLKNFPAVGRYFYVPDFETALMKDWESKIEKTALQALQIPNMAMFGGVPTWNLVLFKRMLEISGKDNLLEIWPELQVYMHGGVGFGPYKAQFKKLIPKDDFIYQEIYNASEGFFAIKDDFAREDMLVLLENGIFYEFIPLETYGNPNATAYTIEEVVEGVPYVILVTNFAGLSRYVPGDTVIFTSLYPHRIQVFGRTQQFLNAFGEEVMISNAEQAIAHTCSHTDAVVSEYTVAPIFLDIANKGGHQWLIEFEKDPTDINEFGILLDKKLQALNSDYEAKRSKNLALDSLKLTKVPKGTFYQWMKYKGRLGGQFKIPRLSNSRKIIDEILFFLKTRTTI